MALREGDARAPAAERDLGRAVGGGGPRVPQVRGQGRAGDDRPVGRRAPADAGQAAAQGDPARRRREAARGGRRAPGPRWRCATGRCSRCSTAPGRASPRRSASTSTTSSSTDPAGQQRAAARQGLQGADRAGRHASRARRCRPTSSAAGRSCSRPAPAAPTAQRGDVPERARRPALAAERLGGDREGGRARRASPPRSRRTRCGTPSPRTCSRAAPTCGWCRSCSGTPR